LKLERVKWVVLARLSQALAQLLQLRQLLLKILIMAVMRLLQEPVLLLVEDTQVII